MSDQPEISRVILDTNAFLFFINNDRALGSKAKELLESDADLLISCVSLWEISIKISIGKLTLPEPFASFIPSQIDQNEIEILPLTLPYLDRVSSLPFHHKDPFDRLIIAQALVEQLSVATSDAKFDSYGVERIWD